MIQLKAKTHSSGRAIRPESRREFKGPRLNSHTRTTSPATIAAAWPGQGTSAMGTTSAAPCQAGAPVSPLLPSALRTLLPVSGEGFARVSPSSP